MKLRHFVKTVDNDRGVDHRMTLAGVAVVQHESVLRRDEVTERKYSNTKIIHLIIRSKFIIQFQSHVYQKSTPSDPKDKLHEINLCIYKINCKNKDAYGSTAPLTKNYACFVVYLKIINTFFEKQYMHLIVNCPRNSKMALKSRGGTQLWSG